MSDIREGIRDFSRAASARTARAKTTRRGPTVPWGDRNARGGLGDALLVGIALLVMGSRTPVGGLLWYASEKIRGQDTSLPSLAAYFETGAVAPPAEIAPLPPGEVVTDDQLPEPWRTAVRTTLGQEIPAALASQLAVRGVAPTPESALSELDALWTLHRDPELVLEIAAIGGEQRERAVARAISAGEDDPQAWEGHRRYLPGATAIAGDKFVGGTLALATALDLSWPLSIEHQVTSPFGDRLHPTLGQKKFHEGVDLGVPIGTAVLAAQQGTIEVVGESGASGRYVIIDHGFGVRTSYCHLSATPVAQGTSIGRGETFALSGNTGRSTGPHLHYGIRIAGRWVDPERFRR